MEQINPENVLVIVPVYNGEKYLPELIPRCRNIISDHNLLFVNDGSTDGSLGILREQQVSYISFPYNRGKGAALQAGFSYAAREGYRSVLTLDSDLQHLPEEIPQFLEQDDGETLIVGTRSIHLKQMPFDRWLSNNLCSLIISIFSTQRVRDSQSGFRLIPIKALTAIQLKTVGYDFESEMLFKAGAAGCSIGEVPISTIYEGSHSYINPVTDTLRFIRLIWKRIWS